MLKLVNEISLYYDARSEKHQNTDVELNNNNLLNSACYVEEHSVLFRND